MPKKPSAFIKTIMARAAIDQADHLPAAARADLYDAVADLLLSNKPAEHARLVAWTIREAEKHQLTLKGILQEASK